MERRSGAVVSRATWVIVATHLAACSSFHGTTSDAGDAALESGADASDAVDATDSADARCSSTNVPVQISAGDWHTCAVMLDGSLRCWGTNRRGQLGYPQPDAGTPDADVDPHPVPMAPSFSIHVRPAPGSMSAGGQHTCAITLNASGLPDALLCWGENTYGQLGTTIRRPADDPMCLNGCSEPLPQSPVLGGGVSSAMLQAVFAGVHHTCLTLSDTTAMCWGRNDRAQLGNGGTTTITPLPVYRSGTTPLGTINDIFPGFFSTCATVFDTSIGNVKCWGDNSYGQLGNGTVAMPTDPPNPTPTAIALSMSVAENGLSQRESHACAIVDVGRVPYCWGRNDRGQVGRGSVSFAESTPAPVLMMDGTPLGGIFELAAGQLHTCARSNAAVYCWGNNSYGEVGDGLRQGVSDHWTTPHYVALGQPPVEIVAGMHHTCALLQDHTVWCWGWNEHGELGNGTTGEFQSSPTQVCFPP